MQRAILFILFCLACRAIYADQPQDSLLLRLKGHPQQDTIRLGLLNEIAYNYYFINPSEGLTMAGEAIALAQKLGNDRGLAQSWRNLGINHWARGDDSLALTAFHKALDLYRKSGNRLSEAKTMNGLALVHYNLSDYSTAIAEHEGALRIFLENKDTNSIANTYNNMGVVYLQLADYPRALETFLHALEMLKDSAGYANALGNIGLVYKNMKNYAQSLEYANRAYSLYKRTGDRRGEAKTLSNIATIYDLSGKPDTALQYYRQALSINKEMGNKGIMASDLTNIGIVYEGLSDYEKAHAYLSEAIGLYRQLNESANISIALLYMAGVYQKASPAFIRKLGFSPAGRQKKMLELQLEALQLARKSGTIERESEALLALSDTYASLNDPAASLRAYKQHIVLRDSIYSAEKEREITRKQLLFDFDKKEALIKAGFESRHALAQEEIKRQKVTRNALAAGSALLLLCGAGGYGLYKRRRDAEEKRREAEYKTEVAETEMKALRAQINPHFIFNSLNAIRHFIAGNNMQQADDYLSRFAKMMRLVLENSEHREVPLADDLAALKYYMDMESLRLKHPFMYEIIIDPDIDPENTLIPPLILQPFVENSIWHGFQPAGEDGKITIHIRKENDCLCCVVEDNGKGIQGQATVKPGGKHSLGMKITESRIAVANKSKNTGGGVTVSSLQKGVRVEVRLPLELNY